MIADDHEVVRSGIRSILEARSGWSVVAEANEGDEAITKAFETKPDIAVIDYCLPTMNGSEVTRRIRARLPNTEVLIFTVHDREAIVAEALDAGALGFVLKSETKEHLIAAVDSLANHRPYFTGQHSERLLEVMAQGKDASSVLTPRECVIVKLIAEGYRNKEIGSTLKLGVKTIDTHRTSAMRKLNVTSMVGLVRYAIRNNLIEP